MTDWRLSARLAWQGWASGEYRVLVYALVLAVACATLLGVLGERMQRALDLEAAKLSGGDLVVAGRAPASEAQQAFLTDLGVAFSQRVQLTSMASREEAFVLVSVNAVDQHYPLLGQVKLDQAVADRPTQGGPPRGEVWIERSLALRLDAWPGDFLTLGDQALKITALLLETPDQPAGFSSFSPRVLVSLDSLEDSALLGPLSRASWRLGIEVPSTRLETVREQISDQLREDQRLVLNSEERPAMARALDEGQRYLGLAGLVAVLLAGLAVALASQRQARRQAKEVALLRCIGLSRARVQRLFILQLLWLGLGAGFFGGLLGYLAQLGLVALLGPLMPLTLPPPSGWPLIAALGLSIWLLLGFSLAPLLSLSQVSPHAVLQSRPVRVTPAAGLTYGLALVAALGVGYWLSGDLLLTLWTLVGLLVIGGLVALLGRGLLFGLKQVQAQMSWSWRQALRRLIRQPGETLLQLSTFTLAFTAVLLVARGGEQLVNDWQRQLPAERPDQFAVDIQPFERQDFEVFLQDQGVAAAQVYPIVRARLTQINQQPAVSQVPARHQGDNTLRRELNLTWQTQLQEGNQLIAGHWWDHWPAPSAPIPVSVESGMAERLGLSLGDALSFNLAGQTLDVQVASLREADWDSFNPNFYVIFPPWALQDFSHTYLASFSMPAEEAAFMQGATRQFPGVAFLDVRSILQQAEGVIRQLSLGVQYLLGFVLLAGLLVTWSLMMASLDARQREAALLKVLGVARRTLARRQYAEFLLLGGLSGLLAAVLGEGLYALMAERLFGLSWQAAPTFWLLPPLVGALLLAVFARFALQPSLEEKPHRLLKRLG